MLKFEEFDTVMNQLIDRYNRCEEWINKVDAAFYGAGASICENIYAFLDVAIELLKKLVDDTERWIEYFFYECECNPFDYWIADEQYTVLDNKDLYNLIVGDKGSKIMQ